VVVAHREVTAKIVLRDAGLEVVRRVHVDPALEDVRGRIGGVDVRDDRLREELRRIGGRRTRRLLRSHGRGNPKFMSVPAGQAGAERHDQEESSVHDSLASGCELSATAAPRGRRQDTRIPSRRNQGGQ
jgi:hypothetical protein